MLTYLLIYLYVLCRGVHCAPVKLVNILSLKSNIGQPFAGVHWGRFFLLILFLCSEFWGRRLLLILLLAAPKSSLPFLQSPRNSGVSLKYLNNAFYIKILRVAQDDMRIFFEGIIYFDLQRGIEALACVILSGAKRSRRIL